MKNLNENVETKARKREHFHTERICSSANYRETMRINLAREAACKLVKATMVMMPFVAVMGQLMPISQEDLPRAEKSGMEIIWRAAE